MLESDQLKMISAKCFYENDEVLVVHNIMSFPDGSKEAVLACHTKKDGKIISSETGATPLNKHIIFFDVNQYVWSVWLISTSLVNTTQLRIIITL